MVNVCEACDAREQQDSNEQMVRQSNQTHLPRMSQHNCGMLTGTINNVLVLDTDANHSGLKLWEYFLIT